MPRSSRGLDEWKAPLLDDPSRDTSRGTRQPLHVGAGDGRSVVSFERQPRGAAVHRTGRGGFSGDEPKITTAVSILDTAPQPVAARRLAFPYGLGKHVHTCWLKLIQVVGVQTLGRRMTRVAKAGAIGGV